MNRLPTPDELRDQLQALDERQKKIVAGVLTLMIQNPNRVKEREWISEQFTQVTLLAGGFAENGEAHEGMQEVQAFLRQNINTLLNASFALFAQVASDLSERSEFSAEEAIEQGLSYL